jgi:hypothetical protein
LLVILAPLLSAGCGLIPTDRPPRDNPYGASYFPDHQQSRWNRILFGTRWIPEGPPPRVDPVATLPAE